MIDLATLYVRNHRDQQYMIVGGMMLALVVSLAPRNERALFVTGGRPAPTAFAAIAPPPVAFNGLFDDSGPFRRTNFRIGTPRRGAGPGVAGPDGFTPADPAGVTPGGGSPVGVGSPPVQLASLDPGGPGITGAPLAGSGPVTSGPGAASAGPASGGTPGGGGAGPGTPTTPVTPVGPVPEPAAWVMMIVGFFGLGAMLRRRSISSIQADRPQT